MLQPLRLCRTSDTVFRREIDSRRQWGYGTCYGDSFPAGKECNWNDVSPLTVLLMNVSIPVALLDTLVGNYIRHLLVLYT